MSKKSRREKSVFVWVHINPALAPVQGIAQPMQPGQQPVLTQGALPVPETSEGEYVEIRVGGKTIRGKLIKVLESKNCILVKDERGVLHLIPLSALERQRTGITVLA